MNSLLTQAMETNSISDITTAFRGWGTSFIFVYQPYTTSIFLNITAPNR